LRAEVDVRNRVGEQGGERDGRQARREPDGHAARVNPRVGGSSPSSGTGRETPPRRGFWLARAIFATRESLAGPAAHPERCRGACGAARTLHFANTRAATPAFPGRAVAGLLAEETPAADEMQACAARNWLPRRPCVCAPNAVAHSPPLFATSMIDTTTTSACLLHGLLRGSPERPGESRPPVSGPRSKRRLVGGSARHGPRLVAEQRKRPTTFSPSAIRSMISMCASGKLSRNGAIQRRAAGAISGV
jgi:hypothetical protein